ncbi:MAG: CvpA family protein [Candidatus Omnitrophota bacterium]
MNLIQRVSWVDVFALILLLRIVYGAYHRGLSRDFFSLTGSILNVAISLRYYSSIGGLASDFIPGISEHILKLAAFVLLVIMIGVILKITFFILEKSVKIHLNNTVEGLGGAVSGILRGSITISIIFCIMALVPIPYMQRSIAFDSLTGKFFLGIGPAISGKFSKVLPIIGPFDEKIPGDMIYESLADEKTLPIFEKLGEMAPKHKKFTWPGSQK